MPWLLISLAYLAGHAVLYLGVLRRTRAFTSERGIFLYHFVSAVLFTAAALLALVVAPASTSLAFAVGTIMLHGVYSLSFLEVWSLTEGSYSFQILRAIGLSEQRGSPLEIAELEQIGSGKQANRTGALEGLSWVTRTAAGVSLTPRGRAVSGALATVRGLVSTDAGQ